MGVRFRKSFKLCPGVRTTFSLSGVSVSAGVKGARLTASKRGLMATLGIPGTGIYYQQNLSKSQRQERTSLTNSQSAEFRQAQAEYQRQVESEQRLLAAEQQRLAREKRLQQSVALIDEYESKQWDIVNCWRRLIDLVPKSAYEEASELRPFEHQELPPAAPNMQEARMQLAVEIRAAQLKVEPVPRVLQLCVIAGSLVPALFVHLLLNGFLGIISASLLYLGTVFVAWKALTWWWSQEFAEKVKAETVKRWPERESQINRQHRRNLDEFEKRRAAAEERWFQAELERTEWTRRLVSGDVDALNEAVTASLSDLDFPFETYCKTYVLNSELVLVNVDLPEIENVISDKSMHLRQDGNIAEKSRNQSERYQEYAQLVAGLVVLLATTACSAAPTVSRVAIGAYTQRMKQGKVVDDYVVVSSFERSNLESVEELRLCDPIRLIKRIGGTIEQTQHGKLKSIDSPDWDSFA
jgi:hypothetical protein